MASVFGISELRSKLEDWRSSRRNQDSDDPETAPEITEVEKKVFELIDSGNTDHDLSVLLENLVIPKLIADRDNPGNRLDARGLSEIIGTPRKRPITEEDVAQFTKLSVEGDARSLLDFVDHCLATGSSVETIYVELLAPTARRLGVFWEEDSRDFVDVTMGLWRIQEILRELTLRIPPASGPGHGQRSALFSTMPGEQHSFGALMVAECFQRAGWDTEVLMEPSQSELTGKFANCHYDLIGLTVSCDCPTGTLSGLVKAIRSVSTNPEIRIMIGGRVINEQPDLVEKCGADGTAVDAQGAVALADSLVPLKIDTFENLA